MSYEFPDYVEDISDAMDKAELRLERVTYETLVAEGSAILRGLSTIKRVRFAPLSVQTVWRSV